MRILIVEDERKIARALGRALKNEKYAVDISHDGTDAYASDLEGFDIAPREERYQTADMVCAEGAKALRAGRTVRYTELMPDYMRQSEAEQKLRDGTLKRLREEKMKRFR